MVPYLRLVGDPLPCRLFQNRSINDYVLILPVGFQPKILLPRILEIMDVVAEECNVEQKNCKELHSPPPPVTDITCQLVYQQIITFPN